MRQQRGRFLNPVRLNIINDFLYPINIFVNGTLVGSVDAARTQYVDTTATPLAVSFELVRPTLDGRALGDTVSGYWDKIDAPSGTYNFEAGYKIGSTYYFLPEVSNRTGTPLEIEVNGGYPAENRCNCFAPPHTENVRAGYYQLFRNSNVRLFVEGSNYSGPCLYYGNDSNGNVSEGGPLYKYISVPSGLLTLVASFAP